MRLTALGIALLMGLFGSFVIAQVDAIQDINEATIIALTGDTDTDPSGVGVLADGSVRFVGDNEPAIESILRWNGTTVSVYASKAIIEAALGLSPINLDFDDMVCSASGDLYAIVEEQGAGAEFIIRVTGVNAVEVVVAGAGAEGAGALDVDEGNGRLVVYLGAFGGAAAPGLYTIPLSAVGGALTALVLDPVIAPQLTPPGAVLDVSDIVVQSDGDIIVANGYGSGDSDGDLVRVTGAGVPTPFADRVTLLTAMGFPGGGTMGDSWLECNTFDEIVLYQSGGTSPPGESFIIGSADGSTWSFVASEATVLADPDISGTDIGGAGNALAMDVNNNLHFASTSSSNEGIIILSGGNLPVELMSISVE